MEKLKKAMNRLQEKEAENRCILYEAESWVVTDLSGVVSTFFGRYSIKTSKNVGKKKKKRRQKVFEGLAARAIWLQNMFSFCRH